MPDISDLVVIWEIIVFLWFSTHNVFTGVSSDNTGYESILVTMSAQNCTGKRCFPVRHWVTVLFLAPFVCVLNIRDTLSARCRHPLICGILRHLL